MKTSVSAVSAVLILILAAQTASADTGRQAVLAYLDPGTGSYILMMVLGVVFGSVYWIKSQGARIGGFIGGLFRKGNKQEAEPADED